MSEPIGLHNPVLWTLLFDTFSIQGFGDGDAISIEPPTETMVAKRGTMGEYAVAIVTDGLHALKINVHQTSATNAVLRAKFRAQYAAGWKPKVCSLKNRTTGETWRGVAWLDNDAPLKVGKEVQNVEWSFGFIVDQYTAPTS